MRSKRGVGKHIGSIPVAYCRGGLEEEEDSGGGESPALERQRDTETQRQHSVGRPTLLPPTLPTQTVAHHATVTDTHRQTQIRLTHTTAASLTHHATPTGSEHHKDSTQSLSQHRIRHTQHRIRHTDWIRLRHTVPETETHHATPTATRRHKSDSVRQ